MSEELQMQCPSCGQSYRLNQDYLAKYGGRTIHCQKCQAAMTVPTLEPEPAAAAETGSQEPAWTAPTAVQQQAPAVPVAPHAAPHALGYTTAPHGRGWNWGEFFAFRQMVTPIVIQVLFWLGIVVVVVVGVIMMIGAFQFGAAFFFGGLGYLILGPILVRIYCELLIIFFRMNDTLNDIRDDLRRR